MTRYSIHAITVAALLGCGPPIEPNSTTVVADKALRESPIPCGEHVTARGHVLEVTASGVDDTATLQCALDHGNGRTVRLAAGTFTISQLVADGFVGRIVGAGAGLTLLQNPEAPMTVTANDYFAAPPSASNPWPVLIAFVDGAFTISDLSIHVRGDRPTTGWSSHGFYSEALAAAISVGGTHASATLQRLDMSGEPSTDPLLNLNLINATFTWNIVGTEPAPLSVTLAVRGCFFSTLASGVPVSNLQYSDVTVAGNRFENVFVASEIVGYFADGRYRFVDNDVITLGAVVDQYDFCPGFACGVERASLTFSENRISGGPIVLEGTLGDGVRCRIDDNTFEPGNLDVFLGPATRDCVVEDAANVIDLGTGNHVNP